MHHTLVPHHMELVPLFNVFHPCPSNSLRLPLYSPPSQACQQLTIKPNCFTAHQAGKADRACLLGVYMVELLRGFGRGGSRCTAVTGQFFSADGTVVGRLDAVWGDVAVSMLASTKPPRATGAFRIWKQKKPVFRFVAICAEKMCRLIN